MRVYSRIWAEAAAETWDELLEEQLLVEHGGGGADNIPPSGDEILVMDSPSSDLIMLLELKLS
jgi:hypothetical protein